MKRILPFQMRKTMTNNNFQIPDANFTFPAKFLWGTATSSYQNEGYSDNSNWWKWENTPDKILNGQKSGAACDWWGGKWKEDFNRAESTFQNAHRLSIEWSRVQPEENRWDESAIEHYRQMLKGLVELGMSPMITLHHFSDPLWLSEAGGWENPKAYEHFAAFVSKIVDALKEFCSTWITINEPNVYVTMGYIDGVFPPGKSDMQAAFTVMLNLVKGHAKAYEIIHGLQQNAQVGIATNYRAFIPSLSWNPLDHMIANIISKNFNYAFNNAISIGKLNFAFKKTGISAAKNTQDFIGVNYYTADSIRFNVFKYKKLFFDTTFPLNSEISENKFIANVPGGMSSAIHWARKFNIPIYITENGIEDSTDRLRPAYILEHLLKIWKSTNYMVPIKGYFYWTLVDNFEWERGWTQKFGLWGIDPSTQMRFRRKSVDLYAEICRTNSVSSDLIQRYAPHIVGRVFPG
jgi:beta-glucosidase